MRREADAGVGDGRDVCKTHVDRRQRLFLFVGIENVRVRGAWLVGASCRNRFVHMYKYLIEKKRHVTVEGLAFEFRVPASPSLATAIIRSSAERVMKIEFEMRMVKIRQHASPFH